MKINTLPFLNASTVMVVAAFNLASSSVDLSMDTNPLIAPSLPINSLFESKKAY